MSASVGSIRLWKLCCDVFNCLPVAALVDSRIFCMHGGISPDLHSMKQVLSLPRPTDIPDSGLLCDLLWADPDEKTKGYADNDRGISVTFGPDALKSFLDIFNLDLVARAHQVVSDGYEFFADRGLVTIFSATNYCGEFDNAGGMLSIDSGLRCSFKVKRHGRRHRRSQLE